MENNPFLSKHPGLYITMYNQSHHHSINIIITNSTFSKSNLTVAVSDYPAGSFTVEINNVTFNGRSVNLDIPLTKYVTYRAAADEWLGARVLINDCDFMMGQYGAMVIRLQPSWYEESLRELTSQHPGIIISNSNFHGGEVKYPHIHAYALSVEVTHLDFHTLYQTKHRPLLTLLHNN